MQFTSPQFLRPGLTDVLFRYLGLHFSLVEKYKHVILKITMLRKGDTGGGDL